MLLSDEAEIVKALREASRSLEAFERSPFARLHQIVYEALDPRFFGSSIRAGN